MEKELIYLSLEELQCINQLLLTAENQVGELNDFGNQLKNKIENKINSIRIQENPYNELFDEIVYEGKVNI